MLKNTYAKLKNGEDVTVAYIGGSITEGAGSTDKKTRGWRSLTTAWLKETYPSSDITEINATIGGTGSDLAVFRLDRDVLKYSPDLLFIEFAVNDTGVSGCEEYEEAMIRRVLKTSPLTDVVLVLTCTKSIFERSLKGEYSDSRISYEVLSEHYDLPLLDIGEDPYAGEEVSPCSFPGANAWRCRSPAARPSPTGPAIPGTADTSVPAPRARDDRPA